MISIADDLGGADIGEVKWIEEKNKVFFFVVTEFDFGEWLVRENGNSFKAWCWFSGHKSEDKRDES